MTLAAEDIIARFAESVGRPGEARRYLERWRQGSAENFAIIVLDQTKGEAQLAALASDLHYLNALGLFPVITDASDSNIRALEKSGVALERVLTPERAKACVANRVTPISTSPLTPTWLESLAPRKVILLGPAGLRDREHRQLSIINVTRDLDALRKEGSLSSDHRERLERGCEILDSATSPLTVAITSPRDLLRELFTVRGAGTLLRIGAELSETASPDAAQKKRLSQLLRDAFGREPRGGLFDRPFERIIVAGDYRGAAMIESAEADGFLFSYLSKFAVTFGARGEGVGRDLWQETTSRCPRLVWRARRENPIAAWYTENADGLMRSLEWTVYWRGLGVAEVATAFKFAMSREDDFASSSAAV